MLDRLLAGLDAIGVDRQAAWHVVTKAALDSIPAIRRSILDALLGLDSRQKPPSSLSNSANPTGTSRRALEDLTAHGIVTRTRPAKGAKNVDRWQLTGWAETSHRACIPELSGALC